MLSGLTPWIVFWVLIGNVPFLAAVLVALAVAVAGFAIGRAAQRPVTGIEIGSIATFSVLTLVVSMVSDPFVARWILPLGTAGLFVVALVSVLIGKPFVHEFVAAEQPADVVKTELFGRLTRVLTRIWLATLGGMTVSSLIPPIVHGSENFQATLRDTNTALSYVCYWIIPLALFGAAALASRLLPARMLAGIDDVARQTSFVAYDEATIDELYYLAQEHANREVGPGKEAYNVKVGGMGTPLTGDESRKSWPSTYKVRDKRH
jgi:hypothetical protein